MDAVFAVDADAGVVFASAACERIFGYTPQEMLGKSMFEMMLPADRERTRLSVISVMAGHPQFNFENRYVRKDGRIVHIMWSARWSPADRLRIGVARDVTERKQAEAEQAMLQQRLQYLADHDQLTGLANRRVFLDRFKHALAQAKSCSECLSVLYIDLDEFKQVNDTRGHGVGDALLQQVASRLRHCVDESDTVARMGGDEFVVLMPTPLLPATHCARKIQAVLRQPFQIEGDSLQISPSVGIASYPEHGEIEEDLLRYADQAMYDMKNVARVRALSEPGSLSGDFGQP